MLVAREGFVPAIAGERHLDVACSHFRQQVCRDLRGIPKGLVVNIGELVNDPEAIVGTDVQLGGDLCRDVGNGGCIFGLVIFFLREADGKRLHRPSEQRCMIATTGLESTPPDRKTPRSMSATMRSLTVVVNSASSWSTACS